MLLCVSCEQVGDKDSHLKNLQTVLLPKASITKIFARLTRCLLIGCVVFQICCSFERSVVC